MSDIVKYVTVGKHRIYYQADNPTNFRGIYNYYSGSWDSRLVLVGGLDHLAVF